MVVTCASCCLVGQNAYKMCQMLIGHYRNEATIVSHGTQIHFYCRAATLSFSFPISHFPFPIAISISFINNESETTLLESSRSTYWYFWIGYSINYFFWYSYICSYALNVFMRVSAWLYIQLFMPRSEIKVTLKQYLV